MIKPQEISRLANSEGVRPQQIEKDYIISWLLWGIYSHAKLKDALIFKGGTCLTLSPGTGRKQLSAC